MSIVILDLNLSNLKSLANSLNQIGIKYRISNNEKIIKNAKKNYFTGSWFFYRCNG